MNDKTATLSDTMQDFILRWGERASHWGLNRTEAQIHALLYLSPKPLNAEEIVNALSIARSNVSHSLKELQQWGLAKSVHVLGDRREHYETTKDVWQLFRIAVDEQKRREIDPVVRMLKEAIATQDGDKHTKERLGAMLEFFETMCSWYEGMKTLPLPLVRSFLKMGPKAVKFAGLKS